MEYLTYYNCVQQYVCDKFAWHNYNDTVVNVKQNAVTHQMDIFPSLFHI